MAGGRDPLGWAIAAAPMAASAATLSLALLGVDVATRLTSLLTVAASGALVVTDRRRIAAGGRPSSRSATTTVKTTIHFVEGDWTGTLDYANPHGQIAIYKMGSRTMHGDAREFIYYERMAKVEDFDGSGRGSTSRWDTPFLTVTREAIFNGAPRLGGALKASRRNSDIRQPAFQPMAC